MVLAAYIRCALKWPRVQVDVNDPHDLANEAHIYEFIELMVRRPSHNDDGFGRP